MSVYDCVLLQCQHNGTTGTETFYSLIASLDMCLHVTDLKTVSNIRHNFLVSKLSLLSGPFSSLNTHAHFVHRLSSDF